MTKCKDVQRLHVIVNTFKYRLLIQNPSPSYLLVGKVISAGSWVAYFLSSILLLTCVVVCVSLSLNVKQPFNRLNASRCVTLVEINYIKVSEERSALNLIWLALAWAPARWVIWIFHYNAFSRCVWRIVIHRRHSVQIGRVNPSDPKARGRSCAPPLPPPLDQASSARS